MTNTNMKSNIYGNMAMKNRKPLVSVIIPTYNRYEKLHRSMKSALDQTHNNIEILVVDDGSVHENKVIAIVNGFEDHRIKYIRHEKNLGRSAARNTGIKKANGQYIAFLDSDDEWAKEKLQKQVDLALKINGSNFIIFTQSLIADENGTLFFYPHNSIFSPISRISEYLFVKDGFLPIPSVFMPSCLAKKCLFDISLSQFEDIDFYMMAEALRSKLYYIGEPLITVHWEQRNHIHNFKPDNALIFINKYRSIDKKIYDNMVANCLVVLSAKYYSRLFALKYFIKINPLNVNLDKYVKLLLFIFIPLALLEKVIDFMNMFIVDGAS